MHLCLQCVFPDPHDQEYSDESRGCQSQLAGNSAGITPTANFQQEINTGVQKQSMTDDLQTYAWLLPPVSDRRMQGCHLMRGEGGRLGTVPQQPGPAGEYQHLTSLPPPVPGLPEAQAKPGGTCLQQQITPGATSRGNSICLLPPVHPQSAS